MDSIEDFQQSLRERVRERQAKKPRKRPPTLVKAWVDSDRLHSGEGTSAVFILGTRGCRWALDQGGCFMCGYIHDAPLSPPSPPEIQAAFEAQWGATREVIQTEKRPAVVKIYTSGSFFDENEIPRVIQNAILGRVLEEPLVEELVVESRPEFLTPEILARVSAIISQTRENVQHSPAIKFEVGIGVESSSDTIRDLCVHKGTSWVDVTRALEECHKHGIGVKAYLLFKPPFTNEAQAIDDLIQSMVNLARIGADTISINPTSIHKGSIVEWLFNRRQYRPPWLFSLLYAMKEGIEAISAQDLVLPRVLCAPTAPGKPRGIHNCLDDRDADSACMDALNSFVMSQDPETLSTPLIAPDLEACRRRWKDALALSNYLGEDLW